MYSVFPYGQNHLDQAKAAINKHSLQDLAVALEADIDVLKGIFDSTFSYNSYIKKSISEFIDDLIKSENIIGNNQTGDFIKSELERIYNPELRLTEEEGKAFEALYSEKKVMMMQLLLKKL